MTILAYTSRETGSHAQSRLVIRDSDDMRLGALAWRRRDGWRFYPAYQAKPSRKGWPTASQALKSYGIQLTSENVRRLGAAIDTLEA